MSSIYKRCLWFTCLCFSLFLPVATSAQLFNSAIPAKKNKAVTLNVPDKASEIADRLKPAVINESIRVIPESFPLYCLPLKNMRLTSSFGWRIHPVTGKQDFHRGIDLSARSDPVFSITDGAVSAYGYHPILGNYIRIQSQELEISYGHLAYLFVRKGDLVKASQIIGLTGATGQVTGAHLHLSIKFRGSYIHPLHFLKAMMDQH